MAKVKISFDGRLYHGTWDITQDEEVFTASPHLKIERGEVALDVEFKDESEMRLFKSGAVMCRGRCKNKESSELKPIFVTPF